MRFIIEHLEKHFDKKEVLKDIDFTFEEGKIYGLLGRNGAGKTTLFNCINWISRQTAGPSSWKKTEHAGTWSRRISGMCCQCRLCRSS